MTSATYLSKPPHRTLALVLTFDMDEPPTRLCIALGKLGWKYEWPEEVTSFQVEIAMTRPGSGALEAWTDAELAEFVEDTNKLLRRCGVRKPQHIKLEPSQ